MNHISRYYSVFWFAIVLTSCYVFNLHLSQSQEEFRMMKYQAKLGQRINATTTNTYNQIPPVLERKEESPVVYTFFDDLYNVYHHRESGKGTNAEDHEILDAWKYAWEFMGYTPKVLTLEDAKRHPDYERFSTLLDEKVPLGSNQAYDKICYLRWLAVAASGGGIMTDFDTIPLRKPQAEDFELPNKFTFNQAYVPSFVHGSAGHWTMMANAILEEATKPQRQDLFVYSDMLALSEVLVNPQYKEHIYVHMPHRSNDATDFLDPIDSQYPIRKCHQLAKLRVMHFQHKSGSIKNTFVDKLLENPKYKSQRAALMVKWLTYWPTFFKEHCRGLDF